MQDQRVLVVASLGAGAEIIGSGDHNGLVNDDHFVVHVLTVAVQVYVQPGGAQDIIFRTGVGLVLGIFKNSRHGQTGLEAFDHCRGDIIGCEGKRHKINARLSLAD